MTKEHKPNPSPSPTSYPLADPRTWRNKMKIDFHFNDFTHGRPCSYMGRGVGGGGWQECGLRTACVFSCAFFCHSCILRAPHAAASVCVLDHFLYLCMNWSPCKSIFMCICICGYIFLNCLACNQIST
ncbi:Hypothetical predicted protein, partial [Drosophila guanche]